MVSGKRWAGRVRAFSGPFRLGLDCLGLKLCGLSHLRVAALGAWPWPQGGSADSEGVSVSIWGPSGSPSALCQRSREPTRPAWPVCLELLRRRILGADLPAP